MTRFEALSALLPRLGSADLALFTTGMISREAFSALDRQGNFYMIGSMGLLSAVGLGLALNRPERRIVVVEGDGSALMSLGNFPLIGTQAPKNLTHVVLDNEAYESTGNQPTISAKVDIAAYADASGYVRVGRSRDLESFGHLFAEHRSSAGPTFLLAKVTGRAPHDLKRISIEPPALRDRFREFALTEG